VHFGRLLELADLGKPCDTNASTHIGLDIDERSGKTESFHSSETSVVEGLAQHYTMLVAKRIASQAPNALSAYRRLIECQPKSYKVQIPWEEECPQRSIRSFLG
jgi:hypothetical protein